MKSLTISLIYISKDSNTGLLIITDQQFLLFMNRYRKTCQRTTQSVCFVAGIFNSRPTPTTEILFRLERLNRDGIYQKRMGKKLRAL